MGAVLRTSERNLFKRCQWQWERSYIDRLAPKKQSSVALWFGTGIHLALEKYYIPGTKRGADPVETWKQYVNDSTADARYINTEHNGDSTFAVEASELGEAMLRSYIEHYGDEEWMDVLAVEYPFQVNIKHQEMAEDGLVDGKSTYVGSIDLIYRDLRDGKVYLCDHKTARALGSSNTQYLPLDDQAGAYYAVAATLLRREGWLGEGERVGGMVYNYLVKSMPDTRPVNPDGYATNKPKKSHYVDEFVRRGLPTEITTYAKAKKANYVEALFSAGVEFSEKSPVAELEGLCKEHGIEVHGTATKKEMTLADFEAEAARLGFVVYGDVSSSQPSKRFDRVTIKKSPRQQNRQIERMADDLLAMSVVRNGVVEATKTPTRECTFCPFLEICELNEQGRDYDDIIEDIYTTWEPYESHMEALNGD